MVRCETKGGPVDTSRRETVTVAEASKLFGFHINTIYRLAAAGHLPTVQTGARRVLFPREVIERMVREGQRREAEGQHGDGRHVAA